MNKKITFIIVSAIAVTATAQEKKDKAAFKSYNNQYYEQIKKADEVFNGTRKPEEPKKLLMDQTGIDVPKSAAEFKTVWAEKPLSQGETGTCWCFSTTSFYEAEINRLTKQEIKLSEPFTVYWQYVEKAHEFVRTRGKSIFDEGSETGAVANMMRKYGLLPANAYTGLKIGQPYHNHVKMVDEMKAYLQSVKTSNAWNDMEVTNTIKSILNFYMGEPPVKIPVGEKDLTALEYMKDVCKLDPNDYVDFMSLMEIPYWTQGEYKAADNWWHSDDFYNVPLDDFMAIVKNSVKNGYSMSIGGDVSESGINIYTGVMMIPTYDIPSQYIDETAREVRFMNGATTDDHAMHLVGYLEKSNGTWFLIKDSGSGGHNNVNSPGYFYMHEDYLKLKMMTITLNKEAVKNYLEKFPDKKLVQYVK